MTDFAHSLKFNFKEVFNMNIKGITNTTLNDYPGLVSATIILQDWMEANRRK